MYVTSSSAFTDGWYHPSSKGIIYSKDGFVTSSIVNGTMAWPFAMTVDVTDGKVITACPGTGLYQSIIPDVSKESLTSTSTFSSKGIGGGGALFAVAINPANNDEYYVSCDMGELFHTTNFGNSYQQTDFRQLIGGHNAKVCFTSTTGLLFSVNYATIKSFP